MAVVTELFISPKYMEVQDVSIYLLIILEHLYWENLGSELLDSILIHACSNYHEKLSGPF